MVVKTLLNAVKGSKGPKVKTKKEPAKIFYADRDSTVKETAKKFKSSKKKSKMQNVGAWLNREAQKTINEATSGLSLKYTKHGEPFVYKGTKPSILTKAKGYFKIGAIPIGAHIAENVYEAKQLADQEKEIKAEVTKKFLDSVKEEDWPEEFATGGVSNLFRKK